MTKTPMLAIDEVAPNQSAIYATINDALRAWEQADARFLDFEIDTEFTGEAVIPEVDFIRNRVFRISEAAPQVYDYFLILPDTVQNNNTYRVFSVVNLTTKDIEVYAWETPSGWYPIVGAAFATVTAGTTAILVQNGADIYAVSGGGGGGGGGITLPDVPWAVHGFAPGVPDDCVWGMAFTETIEFGDNFSNCVFKALTIGTTYEATATFDIETAEGGFGFATIGSISLNMSTGVATWSTVGSGSFTLEAGDYLKITRNSAKKLLPTDIIITLVGTRVA